MVLFNEKLSLPVNCDCIRFCGFLLQHYKDKNKVNVNKLMGELQLPLMIAVNGDHKAYLNTGNLGWNSGRNRIKNTYYYTLTHTKQIFS